MPDAIFLAVYEPTLSLLSKHCQTWHHLRVGENRANKKRLCSYIVNTTFFQRKSRTLPCTATGLA
ncbi:MAG: hypothetical protein CSA33_04125 [Desulfobulbus propionicus]|nr:MAG: hypothetical protein CSA33_04125 [Desulfobulbus propionicus]